MNSKIVGEKHIKSVLIGLDGSSIKTIAFNAVENDLGAYLLKNNNNSKKQLTNINTNLHNIDHNNNKNSNLINSKLIIKVIINKLIRQIRQEQGPVGQIRRYNDQTITNNPE